MLGVGRGANDPTPEKFTVTKTSWRRPRPIQGCSISKEEEEEEVAAVLVVTLACICKKTWLRADFAATQNTKTEQSPPSTSPTLPSA
jgi:hypothetical protein